MPNSDPLAYYLTWTTYGTWLPGDERGWVERPGQLRLAQPRLETVARSLLTEDPCVLDLGQRQLVERTIMQHCALRMWHFHAVNCRTNHVHVVVTAQPHPRVVQEQFKAWCSRRLNERRREEQGDSRVKWWTERGSQRWLNDEDSLEAAILYVREYQ
jgi:REP element-mobilizing transposase RayT